MYVTSKEYILQDKKEIISFKTIIFLFCIFEMFVIFSFLYKSYFGLIYFTFLLGLLIFKKPDLGLYFLAFILPFFGNIPGGKYHLYYIDIIVIMLILRWSYYLLNQEVIRLNKTFLDLWLFIFTFFSIISLFSAYEHLIFEFDRIQNPFQIIYEAYTSDNSKWIYPLKAAHSLFLSVLLYYFLVNNINGLTQIKRLFAAFIIGLFLAILFGIADKFGIISLSIFKEQIEANPYSYMRIHSFFGGSNYLAQFIILLSPFYFAILLFSVFRKKWYHYFLCLLIFITVLLTYQIGGWIVFIIGLFFLFILKKYSTNQNALKAIKKFPLFVGFSILIIYICMISFGLNNNSLLINISEKLMFKDRSKLWTSSGQLFIKNPIYGIGIGNYKVKHNDTFYGSHPLANQNEKTALSTFFQILAESGILALVSLIIILLLSYNLALKHFLLSAPNDPKKKFLSAIIVFISLITIYSIFQSIFYIRINEIIFYTVLGMLYFLTKDDIREIYFFKNQKQRDIFLLILLILLIFRFLLA